MRKQLPFFIFATLAITLMACSGTMRGIDRYSGKRVSFEYQEEKFGKADLHVQMPDGELFMGKLIETQLETTSKEYIGKGYPAVDEFHGNTEAFLFGDRGNKMRCKFRLSDTLVGFKSGGFGVCQISDGRVIDIYTR